MQTRDEVEGLHNCLVCITVWSCPGSPNPSSVCIRLCKHRKKVFYCFYKITSSKNYNAGKDEKFILLIKTTTKNCLVCITVWSCPGSPNPSSVCIRLCKHRKKVFYCFYKITSSKNYNAGKDEKFILLIKMYLPTTLM